MDGEVKKRKRKGERKDKRIQITYTDGVRPDGHPNRISFYGALERKRWKSANGISVKKSRAWLMVKEPPP